jgi:hypothetical protein
MGDTCHGGENGAKIKEFGHLAIEGAVEGVSIEPGNGGWVGYLTFYQSRAASPHDKLPFYACPLPMAASPPFSQYQLSSQ